MRNMLRTTTTIAAALVAIAAAHEASAVTMSVGGRFFSDISYADSVIASTGTFTVSGGASLAQVLTDVGTPGLASWASSSTPGASLTLGFTDNVVVNGAGDDLALFDVGHYAFEYSQDSFDTFKVTINGITRNYFVGETTTIVTLASDGAEHNVNMTTIDLSSFGLAAGATINRVVIGMDFVTENQLPAPPSTPQLMMVAGLNVAPVPEPAAWLALVAGVPIVGAAAVGRRRRAAAAAA